MIGNTICNSLSLFTLFRIFTNNKYLLWQMTYETSYICIWYFPSEICHRGLSLVPFILDIQRAVHLWIVRQDAEGLLPRWSPAYHLRYFIVRVFLRGPEKRVELFNSLRFTSQRTRKTRQRFNANPCFLPQDYCAVSVERYTWEAKLMKASQLSGTTLTTASSAVKRKVGKIRSKGWKKQRKNEGSIQRIRNFVVKYVCILWVWKFCLTVG